MKNYRLFYVTLKRLIWVYRFISKMFDQTITNIVSEVVEDTKNPHKSKKSIRIVLCL